MSFPFPRDVISEIERLSRWQRLQAQANIIGNASLGPDDGAMQILDASGNPVAQVGHSGSSGGLLVPDGSSWRTVQADAQARVDTLGTAVNSRLDGHASRLGNVEGRVSTAEGRLDSHASRLGNAEGRLDGHASRLGNVEGRLTTAEGTLSGVHSEVTTARGGFANLNARLADHASRIGATEGQAATISNLQSQINTLKGDLRELWLIVREMHPGIGGPPSTL